MKIRLLAVAAALACCTSAALAQDTPPTTVTLQPTGNGTAGATFTQSANGLFVDSFVFEPNTINGIATATLTPLSGPVTIFSALLNDEGFGFPAEDELTSFSAQAAAHAGMPIRLTVFGYAGNADELVPAAGSYSVSMAVAVPEPAAYALMLAGLGLLCAGRAGMRRRRAS